MIVKMTILRLLGLSDDKEKIGVARQRIEETMKKLSQRNQDRDTLVSPVELTLRKSHTSVH